MPTQQPDPRNGNNRSTAIEEIDILWITAGLGCDGDTIAITGATQPSLEDLLSGGMPGVPKINFHNPFLAYENGDEFLGPFFLAKRRRCEASVHPGRRGLDTKRN